MNNQEVADELQYAIDLIKQDGKDWLDERDIPILEAAISALQEQEAKTQLSAEGTTSDLISRQDAIEVIEEMQMPIMRSMFPEEQFVFKGMSEALSAIKDLPSAHSEIEERKEESAQNVPKEDLISRKEAIDALDCINGTEEVLRSLPSAQPEPCKDAVSREAAIDVAENAFVRGLLASPDIRRLPSVQPEPQWIPVSERLPEVGRSVLFSRRSMGTREGCLQADGKWWQYRWNEMLNADQVTAWKPLPEPYRAERRTDDL